MSDRSPDRTPDTRLSAASDTWPITAREAAGMLGVHERTIRRAIARGEIPATKRSGTYRIAREDLHRYRLRRDSLASTLPTVSGPMPHLIVFPGGLRAHATTLPRPLTSLVGRDAEIAEVRSAIQREDVGLVTLTGAGGVGKTRLAIEVAGAVDGFPDGAVFVSLAQIRDPELVGPGIAQALGARGGDDRPLVERLGPALLGKRTLLVLDNFEHVLEAAPLVSDLLGAFPGLTVLATSRVRLRITGEHMYVVSPLVLDAGDELASTGEDTMPAAARLFVERARAVMPGFVPAREDASIIVNICRRLDGLPLAIELAAVRVKVAPLAVLLARLGQRLPLLTGGARDLPARQQTMRDTIAWSYDLLTAGEQTLFRRLSVFVGGFTLAAAEHVAATIAMRAVEVLLGLAALIDASLLRKVEAADGTYRYLMLETMREYGQEMLGNLGEATPAHDALAAHYLGLEAWLDPNTIAPGVTFDDRLREIAPEQPNLELALTHLVDAGDPEGALHLAGQCAVFWHHRGYLQEGRRWLEYALANTAPEPTVDRGVALAGLSLIFWTQVEPEAAAPPAVEALAIGRTTGNARLTALALHMLGLVANARLRWVEAKARTEEALRLWREIGERSSEAMALMVLSETELGLGDPERSRQRADAALSLFESMGHDSGAAFAHVRLARVGEHERDDRCALLAYQDALRLWAGIGERWAVIKALVGIAGIAAMYGQPDVAATIIGVIDARKEESGGGIFPVDRGSYDRAITMTRRATGDQRFAELRACGRALSTPEMLAVALGVVPRETQRATTRGAGALSQREREVLHLLAEGRSNAEIADALYIGIRTARSHVASILAKLDVPTRTAAASYAHRHDLV